MNDVHDRRWSVLTAIGVGTFMSALDGSVVNTVLPILSRDLHASVPAIEWVATIYLLVVSALLLGVGRAGDLRGHKRMYIGGFVVFVIGSALCGAAPGSHFLVAMRRVRMAICFLHQRSRRIDRHHPRLARDRRRSSRQGR